MVGAWFLVSNYSFFEQIGLEAVEFNILFITLPSLSAQNIINYSNKTPATYEQCRTDILERIQPLFLEQD